MPATSSLCPAIANRWSPRAFSDRPVSNADLRHLFEAARLAASCFNEQPWRFVIATKENAADHDKLLGLLVPPNQQWAKQAWVLGVTAGKKTFTHNGAPDRFGLHDAGAALASVAIQASYMGLQVHGMGGFDAARARTELGIPEDFEIGAAFALGYVEGPDEPPADRKRKSLEEIVFGMDWGRPAL